MAAARYALLPLALVEGALRLAEARRIGVSTEFAGAYRDVDGDGARLSAAWMQRRSLAIQQELSRPTASWRISAWSPGRARQLRPGPTPSHLRLAAWGFSPAPQVLEVYLQSVGAVPKPATPPRATV